MEKIFSGKLLNVFKKKVTLPNKEKVNLEIIKHPGAALIVPFLTHNKLIICSILIHNLESFSKHECSDLFRHMLIHLVVKFWCFGSVIEPVIIIVFLDSESTCLDGSLNHESVASDFISIIKNLKGVVVALNLKILVLL